MLRYGLGVALLAATVEYRYAGFARCLYSADPGGIPLYRVWTSFGGALHRFMTARAVVVEITAEGWVDEGVATCVWRS